MVFDHSYDIDEMFALFSKWYNQTDSEKNRVLSNYADGLFTYTPDEADDHASLIAAMMELYNDIGHALRNQQVSVIHAAYYEDTGDLIIILDK